MIDLEKYKLPQAPQSPGIDLSKYKVNKEEPKKEGFLGSLFNTAKQDYSNITATKNAGMAAAGTSIPKQILAAGTGVLAAGAEPIKLGWDAIGKALSPIITPIAEKSARSIAQNKIDHPEYYGGVENIAKDDAQVAKLKQGVSDWATNHPQASEALGAILNYASVLPAGKVVDVGAETLKSGSTVMKDSLKSILEPKKVPFSVKTPEEVLATAEKDLPKLTSEERSFYYDNKKQALNEASKKAEEAVKNDLQVKANASQKEAEDLQHQLSVASRDKVIELRPKITQALGRQSQEYRRLVNEELAPFKNQPVNNTEISDFVNNRFAGDENRALQIKQKLGLVEKVDPLSVKPTKLKTPNTIGKIYDQAQSLKQEVKNSSSRVYSPDEKLTDDAVSVLNDYLKTQGVDLKQSRQFWAKYAPLRDQLVNEAKPFLQTPIKTKTFASTLTRVASGKDVNNENFIAETEKLLGEKITKEQSDILSKIDANKKSAIANKIDADLALDNIKVAKESALKGISTAKFTVEQLARRRSIIKNAIKYGVGVIGLGTISEGVFRTLGK